MPLGSPFWQGYHLSSTFLIVDVLILITDMFMSIIFKCNTSVRCVTDVYISTSLVLSDTPYFMYHLLGIIGGTLIPHEEHFRFPGTMGSRFITPRVYPYVPQPQVVDTLSPPAQMANTSNSSPPEVLGAVDSPPPRFALTPTPTQYPG